ncbi:MAG: hypothetical protein IKM51_02675 [Oscillospiraceae bacterium]|nr:hypothetical protein [Oscillospiraceae bacterium]
MSVAIIVIIAVGVFFAARYLYKASKNGSSFTGCSGCTGGSGCSGCSSGDRSKTCSPACPPSIIITPQTRGDK